MAKREIVFEELLLKSLHIRLVAMNKINDKCLGWNGAGAWLGRNDIMEVEQDWHWNSTHNPISHS